MKRANSRLKNTAFSVVAVASLGMLGSAGLLGMGPLGATAHAAAGDPVEFLKKQTTILERLLKTDTPEGSQALTRKKAKIKSILRGLLNYAELGKRSLWMHWKDRSVAERKEFVALLRQLIEDRVLGNLASQTDFSVEYQEPAISGNEASVKMVVRIPNKPEVDIEYKMMKRGNKWWTWDLITDGTSLVRNYRSQFNRIIKKNGFPHLVAKMKEKLRKADSGSQVATAVHAG